MRVPVGLAVVASRPYGRARGADYRPCRLKEAAPLSKPPFDVIEVIPAITFTFRGLLIGSVAGA